MLVAMGKREHLMGEFMQDFGGHAPDSNGPQWTKVNGPEDTAACPPCRYSTAPLLPMANMRIPAGDLGLAERGHSTHQLASLDASYSAATSSVAAAVSKRQFLEPIDPWLQRQQFQIIVRLLGAAFLVTIVVFGIIVSIPTQL